LNGPNGRPRPSGRRLAERGRRGDASVAAAAGPPVVRMALVRFHCILGQTRLPLTKRIRCDRRGSPPRTGQPLSAFAISRCNSALRVVRSALGPSCLSCRKVRIWRIGELRAQGIAHIGACPEETPNASIAATGRAQ